MKRLVPYLVLFAVSLAFWYLGMRLRGGQGLLDHSQVDQHTRQARAWLEGRLDLPGGPEYLEIARYQGRFYVSFPPTPSLVELPLVLVFGKQTPSSLALYLALYLALCAQFRILARLGFAPASAALLPLAFYLGTDLYPFCVRANVWAQGQGFGYALVALGLERVLVRGGAAGAGLAYFLLSLAVGCRPLDLLLLPLFLALDVRGSGRSLRTALTSAAVAMAPFGLLLASLNWARFGNPLEFGHVYMPWLRDYPAGIFSLGYLPENLYHAFLRLPEWRADAPHLYLDPQGTAFWLNNAIFLFGLYALAARPLDPWLRRSAAFGLVSIGLGVLLYAAGGGRQLGFRYFIDLLPIGFVALALGQRRVSVAMLAALAFSLALNLYGLATWKELTRAS